MADIHIPPQALEAAARAVIIFNGGDPDKELRLSLHKTTIKQWEQVAPVIEAAIRAALKAWPGMTDMAAVCFVDGAPYPRVIHLPVTETANDRR